MCSCDEETAQCTYRSEAEYQRECSLIARHSQIEHDVFGLLLDAAAPASPLAHRFAALIRSDPATLDGAAVADVLATDNSIYWWLSGSGAQYHAQLDARPAAVRLVA